VIERIESTGRWTFVKGDQENEKAELLKRVLDLNQEVVL
jgi:hypothetical protein